jgi:hypothetical protein
LTSTANLSLTLNAPRSAITINSPAVPLVPSTSQTFKPGAQITVAGTFIGTYTNLSIQWAAGVNPSTGWSTTGITLNGAITLPVTNETLGIWNTSNITAAGYYTLRVSASISGVASAGSTIVYLDPGLFSTYWPKLLNAWSLGNSGPVPTLDINGNTRLAISTAQYPGSAQDIGQIRSFTTDGTSVLLRPFKQDGSWSQSAAGILNPGSKDSIVGTDSSSVVVWNPDGTSTTLTPSPSLGSLFFFERAPVVLDVDGDSLPEVVAMGTQPNSGGNGGTPSGLAYIFAWRNNGQLLNSNFPLKVPDHNLNLTNYAVPRFVVGDVNGDGAKEFVVIEGTSSVSITPRLYSINGVQLAWYAPHIGIPCQLSLADLDHNGKLETILFDCNGTLHILQPDGTERPGWPQNIPYSFGTVTVGDLNQDGNEEIVVSSGNIYVFKTNGTRFSNAWPLMGNYNQASLFFYAQAVLADVNGDGFPEIVTTLERQATNGPAGLSSYLTAQLIVLDRFGYMLRSWNLPGARGEAPGEYVYPSVGDFNHDGLTEIAVQYGLEPSGTAKPTSMFTMFSTGASYHPNANDWPMMYRNPGNTSLLRRVGASKVTLALPTGSIIKGQQTTFTIQVASVTASSNTPSGAANLIDGSQRIGACQLSSGSCTVSVILTVGSHNLFAGYVGDKNFGESLSAATAVNAVNPPAAKPTFNVAQGTYYSPQTLTITDTTAGASIYYTTNGSTPTTSSTKYSSALVISTSAALKAIAVASGYSTSDTASASYTILPPKVTPTVTAIPSASSITTAQGLTVTVTVNTVSGKSAPTGSVILKSGSYSSAAITLSSNKATITIPAATLAVGTDTLTAQYTPDSGSSTTYNAASGTNTVKVSLPQSFSLTTAAGSLSALIGGSAATSKISVIAANGFTGAVTFKATGLPTGVTAAFNPVSSTSSSTVSLAAGATATPGSYAITITGTSGSLTASTLITVTVPKPSFTLTSSTNSLSVVKGGGSVNATITVTNQQNFSVPIDLGISGLPTGVTAILSAAATKTTSTVSFSASASAKAGVYAVTIKGTVGASSNTYVINITIR